MQLYKFLLIRLKNSLFSVIRDGSTQLINESNLKQLINQRKYLICSPFCFINHVGFLQTLQTSFHSIIITGKYKLKPMKGIQTKTKHHPFASLRDKKIKQIGRSLQDKIDIDPLSSFEKIAYDQVNEKNRGKSNRKSRQSRVNLNLAANCSFMELGRELKSKRTLLDENTELRRRIQSLANNKASRRGSITKKLSTQFQKQIYWNGSQSYMISGIKLQYQKMKEEYLKKSDQYQELIRSTYVAQNMEFLGYIEALEVENHILARQIELTTNKKGQQNNSAIIIFQLTEKINKYQTKIKQIKQKNKNIKKIQKQLQKKIDFLEKLVINKDNDGHAAIRNNKKMQKQRQQLQTKLNLMETSLHQMKQDHDMQIQQMKNRHVQKLDTQLNKQSMEHKQQINVISRLQRQNKYLQNLVDCWKQQKNNQNKQEKQTPNSKSRLDKSQVQSEKSENHSSKILRKTNKIQNSKQHLTINSQQGQQEVEDQLRLSKIRNKPYTSDQKYTVNAVKNRRVQLYQIQHLIEFSRYVLISKQLTIQWLVNQLQGGEDDWSKQYINMKQLRTMLFDHSGLNEQQALLVARYMIQHSHKQYVYTDDINEHHRSVVKSIIKNLYGQYAIYKDLKEDFQHQIKQCRSKLEWTLENTTKDGVVTKQKLIDLMNSLSIEMKKGFDKYCIAKIAKGSASLEKLKYKLLFEDDSKPAQ